MKKKSYNKAIASSIIAAQVTSDLAKATGNNCLYSNKDSCIKNTIKIICRSHSKEYRFSVQQGDARAPYLIYFTYRNGSERLQISFHSFSKRLRKYMSKEKTTWDKKSSREAAMRLAEIEGVYFDLKSQNKYKIIEFWEQKVEEKLA